MPIDKINKSVILCGMIYLSIVTAIISALTGYVAIAQNSAYAVIISVFALVICAVSLILQYDIDKRIAGKTKQYTDDIAKIAAEYNILAATVKSLSTRLESISSKIAIKSQYDIDNADMML